MSSESDTRRVHFKSPSTLLERFDTVANLFDSDRTTLLQEAMRSYLDEQADDEEFRRTVAERYFADEVSLETVRDLLGTEEAQRLQLLRADVDAEPLGLNPPTDESIYDDGRVTVDPSSDDVDEPADGSAGRSGD